MRAKYTSAFDTMGCRHNNEEREGEREGGKMSRERGRNMFRKTCLACLVCMLFTPEDWWMGIASEQRRCVCERAAGRERRQRAMCMYERGRGRDIAVHVWERDRKRERCAGTGRQIGVHV